MCILKKGNSNTKSLAYASLVWPILEYVSSHWDLYRAGEINAIDWVQTKAAKFAHQRDDLSWETLEQCREITRMQFSFNCFKYCDNTQNDKVWILNNWQWDCKLTNSV
jgi:hypothetical protein